MPSRIISSGICKSESLAGLSWFEQMLFIRLIVSVDDYGRYDARPQVVKGSLFPFDDVTVNQVQKAITKLSTNGMISLYEVAGKPYLELCAWRKYNTPRSQKSKYPEKQTCEQMQADENTCEQMQADSPVIRNSIFDIRNSIFDNSDLCAEPENPATARTQSRARFVKPTTDEVKSYCLEQNYQIDAGRFVDYYESNGWKVGKNPMKDWKAAVRTWEKNEKPKNTRKGTGDQLLDMINSGVFDE